MVYVSGQEGVDSSDNLHFTPADLDALESATEGKSQIDVLLSSMWPRTVDKFAKPVDRLDTTQIGSSALSKLAMRLRPRYHFAAGEDEFYERVPYR